MTPSTPEGENLPPLPDDVHDELLAILFGDPRLRGAQLQQLMDRAAGHRLAIAAHVAWHEAGLHPATGAPTGTIGPWVGDRMPTPRREPDATARDLSGDPAMTIGTATPEQIGPYRILDTLGEGGMGTVYLAEQQEPVRLRVALKLIKLGMDSKAVVARFEQERQALAKMQHDGIAKVFNCGTSDRGQPYFVMELVKGVPLNQFCEHNRLPLPQRLVLMQQVCAAVQHAHQKGVVHRDLKPGNVLVCDEGGRPQIKIIDFGLAKAIGKRLEASLFTEAGQVVGTPEYMAPEQADATNQDIDTRADVYSLGVMLYEVLVGALPFPGHELRKAGMLEVQRILRDVEPPRPSTRLSSSATAVGVAAARRMSASALVRVLERDLDWVVLKALEKDRNRRYETANALAADLQRFLDHEPLLAGPPSASYRLRKLVRRYRGQFLAAASVLVALVGGGIGTFVQYVRAEDKAADAEQRAGELARVLAFEESQWKDVDSESMGLHLRRSLLARVQEARRDDLEADLAGVNFTSLALGMLEKNLFDRSLAAIGSGFAEQPHVKARLLDQVARTLKDLGLLERATAPQAEALEIRRRFLGDEDPDTLTSISNMGTLLLAKGRLAEAEPFLREALEKGRRILGDAHLHTLIAIGNMGLLRKLQGKLAEAEPYCREALENRRRALGNDHSITLIAMLNLGALLVEQGNHADAEPLYGEAMERSRRTLGDEHPNTLCSISNMGLLLGAQGKLTEAESLLREVLAKQRRIFGDEHPNTLTAIGNVAGLLLDQARLTEAEPFFREVLATSRRTLGDDHPSTLNATDNLGLLLAEQGNLSGAEKYHREALERSRRILGDDHPTTLDSIANLGAAMLEQGRLVEAEPLCLEALTKSRTTLGDDHPTVLQCINNMGALLQAQGMFAEAERYYREAMDRSRRVLGDHHPKALHSINNMGFLLQAQGKLNEAEPYYREALAKSQRVLGPDHTQTLTLTNNLALLLQTQGKFDEAEPFYRDVLDRTRRTLDEDHPNTLAAIHNMGFLLQAQGKLDEAELAYREVLAGWRRAGGDEHPFTLITANNLGRVLVQEHRYQEAIDLLSALANTERRVFLGGNAHRLAFCLRTLGDARVGLALLEALPGAEADLLEAHRIYGGLRGSTHKETRDCARSLVSLYEAWHAAEPGGGHDKQAEAWRAKLAAEPDQQGSK